MQPGSLGIEEHRIADLYFNVTIPHRIIGAHALANALRPSCNHAQPDPVAEHWRERDRGHVAIIILDPRRRANRQEMRACAQPRLAIDRTESRKRGPVLCNKRGTLRHDAPDAILLPRHQPSEAEIARGELPVDLVARYVPLLDAHHSERLDAIGHDA